MNLDKFSQIAVIFIALTIIFVILNIFQAFLRPFIIALILSFLFVPLTRMSKQRRRTIWFVTFGIIAGLFLSVGLLSTLFIEDTTEELGDSNQESQSASGYLDYLTFGTIQFAGLEYDLNQVFDGEELSELIDNFIASLVGTTTSFLTEFFLVLVFLFFLLPSHDLTLEKIGKDLKPRAREKFYKTLHQIETNIRYYLVIKSAISAATAILSAIIMFAFGVNFVVLLAFLIFLLNFIPSLGSIVAVTVVLIVHFVSEGLTPLFIVFAILIILVQIIMGNFVDPKYTGKSLQLSPIIILLSLFFWGSVWGIAGMFFAVPLTSIIKIVLGNIEATKGVVRHLK